MAAEAVLGNDFLYNAAFTINLGESLLKALKIVSQLVVLQTQKVQDRSVQVAHLDGVFDGFESKIVGRSKDGAAFGFLRIRSSVSRASSIKPISILA